MVQLRPSIQSFDSLPRKIASTDLNGPIVGPAGFPEGKGQKSHTAEETSKHRTSSFCDAIKSSQLGTTAPNRAARDND